MPDTTRSGRPLEDLRDRDVDAVGRRAVDGVHAIGDVLEPQRTPQRQRVADRARLVHRRDDGHLAERRERVGERRDALRAVAVVVGDENATHAGPRL